MVDVALNQTRPLGARRAFMAALLTLLALAVAAQASGLFLKNLHWDEFIFLKNIFLHLQGEMTRLIQTSYVHLFSWLPRVAETEAGQIVAGRCIMFAAWLVSLGLLYRLGLRYLDQLGALAAAVCFALFSYSQHHAASFRADSLLLPLLLAMVLLLSDPTPRRIIAAGALGGLGLALSIKAVLWAPAALGLLLVALQERPQGGGVRVRARGGAGAAALAVFAAILGLHSLLLSVAPARGTSVSGNSSFGSIFWEMFVAEGFLPRWRTLVTAVLSSFGIWVLILGGLVLALRELRGAETRRRAQRLLWLATPLLFVALYHNAWPYAYLVLIPTACLLAGLAFSALLASGGALRRVLAALLLAGIALQGATAARVNLADSQKLQRQVLGVVHEIFPEPVPYIDKTGMVASFPRQIFTMTTYGLRVYRARGEAGIAAYIHAAEPPLLIVNWRVLDVWPGGAAELYPQDDRLFPEDEALLRATYAPFWGPLYLAGREWRDLPQHSSADFALTFAGSYTLFAEAPLRIDGRALAPGESRYLEAGSHSLSSPVAQSRVRLLWGENLKLPDEQPAAMPLYGY
ncbi:MAG: hypothetical protein WD489_00155 [Rhodovibrionaceae bacterium]